MASSTSLVGRMTKLAISNSRSLSTCSSTSIISRSVASSATLTSAASPILQTHHTHSQHSHSISIVSQHTHRSLATASAIPKATTQKDSVLATGPDGTQYLIPRQPLGLYAQRRHSPKLAPRIVHKRISQLKTTDGKVRSIRHSPWRMNLVCQFAAGQTVLDALTQLKFCEKAKAPVVADLIVSTAAKAKVAHGLMPSQLEVAECFATHGTHLKRVKIMGRGRAGTKHRRFSHVKLVLREIDFPLKIMQATSPRERAGWIKKMDMAMQEVEAVRTEREEVEKLEREYEAMQREKAKAAEEKN